MTGPEPGLGPAGAADGELVELLGGDPELLELSRLLRAARPRAPEPAFQAALRARLMDEAGRRLGRRGLRRLLPPRAPGMVLTTGGAAVGVAMIAAVVATLVLHHPNDRTLNQIPSATSSLAGQTAVGVTDAIRVSFSEPMDHASVERGLRIQPATTYTVEWQGNDLLIHPSHPLAPDTPYSVTIPRTAARASGGQLATTDIRIPFGTSGPAPVPAGPVPAAPRVTVLGQAIEGSSALFGRDGSLIAGAGLGGRSSPAPPGDDGAAALRRYDGGAVTRLGGATRALAAAPDGRHIALVEQVAGGDGGRLVVAGPDGSDPQTLAPAAADSPLAWTPAGDQVVFVSGGRLRSVDLLKHVSQIGDEQVFGDQTVVLAPGGRQAYLGPHAGGPAPLPIITTPQPATPARLLDLATGSSTPLAGGGAVAAFSGDGATLAWVDGSGPAPAVRRAATAGGAASLVPTRAVRGDTITDLALNQDASRFAYVLGRGGGQQLRIGSLPDAGLLGAVDGPAARPVFDATGSRVAYTRGTRTGAPADLAVADLGGAAPPPASPTAELDAFLADLVQAQSAGDTERLRGLQSSPGVGLDQRTPGQLTRGFVVSVTPAGGSALTVHVRLVRDAAATAPAVFSDETLTVDRAGADRHLAVTAATIPALAGQPGGPHVVHVDSHRTNDGQGTAVVSIQFDSDLDPSTVDRAVTIGAAGGGRLDAVTSYDAGRRTVVATVHGAPDGPLAVSVSRALLDVSGQALDAPYQAVVGGG